MHTRLWPNRAIAIGDPVFSIGCEGLDLQAEAIPPARPGENRITYIVNLFLAKLLPAPAMVVRQLRVGVRDGLGFRSHAF